MKFTSNAKKLLLFFAFLFPFAALYSQQIQGTVLDASNGKSLAFVNILFDQSKQGTITDIDGRFTISSKSLPLQIKLSYVGFFDTIIPVARLNAENNFIYLRAKTIELSQVEILPGENPAHRIILKTIENRNLNNPEKLASFRYQAYHKMIFTRDLSAKNDSLSPPTGVSFVDTIGSKMDSFFDSQHLFLMESVSERIFKSPDKSYEKIVGAKISGMQDAFLVTLAQSMQSFSFYSNRIAVFDKWYVNPISPGATSKYFFLLEDTLYDGVDTTFLISFRPFKKTNFEGLKGLLYINTNGYAIQNVIAEPAKMSKELSIKIQQKYEFVHDSAWFPVQLNTDLIFNQIYLNESPMVGIGRSYLKNIEINPEIRNREFGAAQLEITSDANKTDSLFWVQNRTALIDAKEQRTYAFNDSLGMEYHLDAKLKAFKILSSGFIPLGPVKIDLNSLLGFNVYEGFRWGMGIYSSEKVIPWLTAGGYFAYGIKDKMWKYGTSADFRINHKSQSFFKFSYSYDLEEPAAQKNYDLKKDNPRLSYRFLILDPLFYTEKYFASFRSRLHKGLSSEMGFVYANNSINTDYAFATTSNNLSVLRSSFSTATAFVGLRWARNEKIIRTVNEETNLGTNFPIVNLRYSHGFSGLWHSEFDFNRIDFELKKSFAINYLGRSSFLIRAGYIDKALPYYLLFNGNGSKLNYYIHSPNSFASMKANEFLHDRYAELFFTHNFGKLLINTKYFQPQIAVVFNVLYGALSESEKHRNIDFITANKGYFESGLLLNNLLISDFSSFGMGVFYRIGNYAYVDEKENFAFNFSMKTSF